MSLVRRTSVRRVAITIALGATIGAGAVASPATASHNTGRNLSAFLTGAQEVGPNPATINDPDGWGAATVRVWPTTGRLCYTLFVHRIDAVTAAHIHRGRTGETGAMIVPLAAPTGGWARGCVNTDKTVAQEIADRPRRFYVNVHSTADPDGAVRGQLHAHHWNW